MNDIRRVLRQAAWRVWLMALGRALTFAATVVLSGIILLRIAQQLFLLTLPWQEIAVWSAVGGVLAAVLWTIFTRADRAAVARRVDEGADLREALSTALCIERSDDPWSRAALESAAERARTVQVRQAVPMQAPRFWPVPLALALSLVVVWIAVQPIDLFGAGAVAQQKEEQQRQMEQARFEVESATQKLEEMLAKLDAGLDEADDAGEADKPEATTPDEVRRDAIRKLTSLKDRLEELRNSEKAQALETLEKQLRQLRTPGEGPLTELANHLARADFSQAAEELQKLMEKLESSGMTPEQKEQLAQQLEKLAEQLQKLADERKELEDALQKAGLDKSLAGDPQALKEALEKSENLTQEQKEQLQKMAEAASQACQMCQNMGGAMEAMSKSMSESGMGEQGMDAMEALMNELGQLEQMAQELDMADAAAAKCRIQLSKLSEFAQCNNPGMGEFAQGLGLEGTCPWASGSSQQQGMGAGGPGRGQGGAPGSTEADFAMEKKKVKSPNLGGPIVSQIMIQGEQVRGESKAEFAAAVAAAEQRASEEIVSNVIPREYHDAVKHYFGRLQAKARAEEVAAPAPPPASDAGGDK